MFTQRFRQFAILLVLFIGLTPISVSAKPARTLTPACVLDILRSWDIAKVENPVPPEPDEIKKLNITPKKAAEYYQIGLQGFREAWNPTVIENLQSIARDGKSGSIAEKALAVSQIKTARVPLKILRALFFALSEDHECPAALDKLTKALGSSGDVLKGLKPSNELDDVSGKLSKALEPKQTQALEKALASFKPTDEKGFEKWFDKTAKEAKSILSQRKGLPVDFHQARKDLQALLAVYQMKMVSKPDDPELQTLVTYLWRRTEDIGEANEGFEVQEVNGEINYDKDIMPFPKDVCDKALAFLKRLKKSRAD